MFKDKKTAIVGTLVVALFLSLLTLLAPGKALAASFLWLSSITGESTDDKHKDWVEVISWSFSETNSGTAHAATAGGAGAGKVTMQDLKVSMRTSKASPKLFLACASGEHIKEVKLEVWKSSGDNKMKFLEIKLSNVIVSSFVSVSGSASTEAYPMEEIMLNFGRIEITYTETDPKTGKPKGDIKSGWDLTANKKV